MRFGKIWCGASVAALLSVGCGGGAETAESESEEWTLDRRSWNQGTFAVMAEMVDYGVKKLALGAALPPEEMDLVVVEALPPDCRGAQRPGLPGGRLPRDRSVLRRSD